MESDVASAVAFKKFDAPFLQNFGRGDYVRRFRVSAQRDDWRVLEQEKDIADFLLFAQGD